MNKIKLLIFASASLFMTNCNNLIDENLDPDSVIEENVFKTVGNAEKVVLGAYSRMPLGANIYTQALITDEVRLGPNNNGQGKEVHSWDFTAGAEEFASIWYGAYRSISSANKYLLNMDNINTSTPEELALKNRLKGEALAIRAFNHFLLIRGFSPKYNPSAYGIPYVTSDDIFATPSRGTMSETYQKILDDAENAYALLPITQWDPTPDNPDNRHRFTQGAVRAMQAYIALEMNNFDGAISYADQALAFNSTLASSQPDVQAMWTDVYKKELYFYQVNVPGSASAAPGAYFTTNPIASGGLIYFNPGINLFSKFSPTDYRRARYFSGSPTAPYTNFIVNKYPGTAGNYGINNIKVFRVADMHLVKAEAYARKSAPDLAASYASYNIVRTARNAGLSSNFTSQADAIDAILEERWREFAWEGSRLFDLKRNGMLVTRVGDDIYPINPQPVLTNINRYTFPIPTSEMQANPGLQGQQNAGY